MSQLPLWLTVLGGLVLLLGLGAGVIESRWYLPSQPIVAVALGVIVGPHGLDLLRLTPIGEPLPLLKQVARFTVAFAVTSIALRLEPAYFRGRARSLAAVLGLGMVAMWLVSALVVSLALPAGYVVALLVGAVVTPTDPVLANSIVVGETAIENIPKRLRYFLSGEAGINDGAAYLFVFMPALVASRSLDAAVAEWVTTTLLREVVGGVVLGLVLGAGAGLLERWESAQDFLEETSVFTITVALTFFVLGATELAGTNEILAVFVAGVAYNWGAEPRDEAKEQRVQEVFNRLFTVPVFIVFGMVLPWSGWLDLGWRGVALVAGILLFRRLPAIFALRRFIEPLDRPEATLFVGWFGPIGVAAIFYALLATERTGTELPWIAGSLVVTGSVFVHGMTSTPATHRYGRLDDSSDSW